MSCSVVDDNCVGFTAGGGWVAPAKRAEVRYSGNDTRGCADPDGATGTARNLDWIGAVAIGVDRHRRSVGRGVLPGPAVAGERDTEEEMGR